MWEKGPEIDLLLKAFDYILIAIQIKLLLLDLIVQCAR